MKKVKALILLGFIIVVGRTAAQAPPPPPGGGGSTTSPGCWPPPCTVPIDGGIGFLIAAGVGLGAKKLYNNQKKES